MAMVRPERRFGDVVGVHPHLVVARTQIELGEEASPKELIQELEYHRDGELVLGRLGVEGAVVNAETPSVVRLPDKEHRRRERRGTRSDDALGKHGLDLPLQLVLL